MNPLKMTFTKISKGTFVMGGPGKEHGDLLLEVELVYQAIETIRSM